MFKYTITWRNGNFTNIASIKKLVLQVLNGVDTKSIIIPRTNTNTYINIYTFTYVTHILRKISLFKKPRTQTYIDLQTNKT